ncbi:hypothetical protein HMPREF9420_0368 [Segatella salivae DSM 15606]|uniref:Uncharacterized protein n=1 Tax=Segatella salivae DSM 15606 TaxID=888832 RepID=E6MLK1_9BACT|nr:hypothetical protein HMPREF9420_0368 [Segatella salivae DSM 15606]
MLQIGLKLCIYNKVLRFAFTFMICYKYIFHAMIVYQVYFEVFLIILLLLFNSFVFYICFRCKMMHLIS